MVTGKPSARHIASLAHLAYPWLIAAGSEPHCLVGEKAINM